MDDERGAEHAREGAIAHIEAARIGAECRHHHPRAVGDEAAPADGAPAAHWFLQAGQYDARGLVAAVGVSADPDSPHELRSLLRGFQVN